MNGKRAKRARRDAERFAAEHPDMVEAEGHYITKEKGIICAPKGPRKLYQMVKRRFGARLGGQR